MLKPEIIERKDAEISYLKAELEIVKKLELNERQVKNNKLEPWRIFSLIEETINKYSLENMILHICRLAGVSRSGYYNYLKTSDIRNQKEEKDLIVKDVLLRAFYIRGHKKGYKKGPRSIKMYLANEMGIIYSRKRIQRIMRKYKIVCPFRKANPYKRMAKATKEHRVVPNILNRNFKQEIPGKVLLTDITYMPYNNGDIGYLSTIKDGSTNEILAYHLSKRITLDIAITTIEKLAHNKRIKL